MGREYVKRPHTVPEGVNTLTSTDAGATLQAESLNAITSGSTAGTNVYVVPTPRRVGDSLSVIVAVNTTDAVDLVNASTATLFFATTGNAVRFSTQDGPMSIELIANTLTQWSPVSFTSGVTFLGTTVSTG